MRLPAAVWGLLRPGPSDAHAHTRALRTTHYRLPCQYVQVDLYFFAYVLTVSQAGLYFCMRQRVHPRFAGWA